jgi:tripeptide aminopeptidase
LLDELKNRTDSICAEAGAKYSFSSEVMIHAYRIQETSDVCIRFADACRSIGLKPVFTSTRAGSDNNIFALHDLPGIVVGCGSRNTHTVDEFIRLDDLYKGAELVEKLLISG